jgi:hypothetical protein
MDTGAAQRIRITAGRQMSVAATETDTPRISDDIEAVERFLRFFQLLLFRFRSIDKVAGTIRYVI